MVDFLFVFVAKKKKLSLIELRKKETSMSAANELEKQFGKLDDN